MGVSAVVVASSLHDPHRLSGYVTQFLSKLDGIPFNGVRTDPEEISSSAAVIFVATGGTEHIVLESVKRSKLRYVLLVYHDYENSLPAVLEVAPALRVHAWVDIVGIDSLHEYLGPVTAASRTLDALGGSRILVVGGPSPWLVYSSSVDDVVSNKLGVMVEYLSLDELYAELERVSEDRVAESEEIKQLRLRSSVGERHLAESYRLYIAINEALRIKNAKAVSVRCFDFVKDIGIAGCLAVSKLLDAGVVAGCEADLPSTVTMMILKELSRSPPWMANVVRVGRGEVELAHCTVATSIVDGFTLTTHFESGLPTAVAGKVREGLEVTVAKYDPKRNLIRAALGRVLEGAPKYGARCRTQVRLGVPEQFSRKLIEDPLGAHVAVSFTNVAKPLVVLARMLGIEVEVFT